MLEEFKSCVFGKGMDTFLNLALEMHSARGGVSLLLISVGEMLINEQKALVGSLCM